MATKHITMKPHKIVPIALLLAAIGILTCTGEPDPIDWSDEIWTQNFSSSSSENTLPSSSSSEIAPLSSSSSEEPSSSSEALSSSSSEEPSSSSEEPSSSSATPSSSSEEPSSSSATPSSSSEEPSSSSAPPSSSSAEPSSSSATPSSSSAIVWVDCGVGGAINPEIAFCYEGIPYALCGGSEYDPDTEGCDVNVVRPKCGDALYNPNSHFCAAGNKVTAKCDGKNYNIDTEFCLGGKVEEKCNGKEYTLSQSCYENVIYGMCGSKSYNTETQRCSAGNIIEDKCGTGYYNPATQFCYNGSKIGDYCGDRTETFNPDLYVCKKGGLNEGYWHIYLKTPVSYGNKDYEAVLIGEQTWMAKNLSYNAAGSKCVNATDDHSPLSDSDTEICKDYGRLYNWYMAMAMDDSEGSSANPSGVQGVCPSGWHLPSKAEWDVLIEFAGGYDAAGNNLKEKNDGNGQDAYGFAALPGGFGSTNGNLHMFGTAGLWWSATESSDETDNAWCWRIQRSIGKTDMEYGQKYQTMYSVRCLRDPNP